MQYQVGISRTQFIEFVDPATGQSKQVQSLDQVPPDLRAHIEEFRRQVLQGAGEATFVYRDLSGQQHTYQSPQEMPPEVCSLFEHVRKLAEKAVLDQAPADQVTPK